ncbi:hypothetical protein BX661DRAFT_216626 [Kickxella alabastrina]|uniref:uncharacterized protein n=1 Tax=Kickxella alabastrina TaxID=61397 RepID=UPI00221EF0C0|nr:uncharacterized protein BX661DRAFT_216626 [Kickxella alabastrina]KAI7822273.1 hypothetical protein BX661DRAFT_216626 [Kickxella alabastrina]
MVGIHLLRMPSARSTTLASVHLIASYMLSTSLSAQRVLLFWENITTTRRSSARVGNMTIAAQLTPCTANSAIFPLLTESAPTSNSQSLRAKFESNAVLILGNWTQA